MSRRVVVPCLIALAVSPSALAQSRGAEPGWTENVTYAFAEVLSADPVFRFVRSEPREECYDERVRGDATAGTVLGAVVGGALGNQVGRGDGRRAATIAGAVVGGAVGNNMAQNGGQVQTRCRIVEGETERREIVGYDVQYRFQGQIFSSRLDYDPGSRLRVRVSVTPAD
jgi:uncharacterized protein YcfJ